MIGELATAVGASLLGRVREFGSTSTPAAAVMRNGLGLAEPALARPLHTLAALAVGLLVLVTVTFLTLREAARRKLDAAGVKVLPWKPHLILRVYRTSHRNLLESVRCVSCQLGGLHVARGRQHCFTRARGVHWVLPAFCHVSRARHGQLMPLRCGSPHLSHANLPNRRRAEQLGAGHGMFGAPLRYATSPSRRECPGRPVWHLRSPAGSSQSLNRQQPPPHAPPRLTSGAVVGTEAFVHITDPAAARAVLLSDSALRKRPLYNAFKSYAGEGVFTADGKDWCAQFSRRSTAARSYFLCRALAGCCSPRGRRASGPTSPDTS